MMSFFDTGPGCVQYILPKYCATCGKPRGVLEARRESWGLNCKTVIVPRPEDPALRPWQITNDLIYNAGVWRNGGCDEGTHVCDDCLRIGLRAIKLEVDRLLEVVEAGADKDAEIAKLTQRLGVLQHAHHNLQYDFGQPPVPPTGRQGRKSR